MSKTEYHRITFTNIEKDMDFWRAWLLMPFKKGLSVRSTKQQIESFIKSYERQTLSEKKKP